MRCGLQRAGPRRCPIHLRGVQCLASLSEDKEHRSRARGHCWRPCLSAASGWRRSPGADLSGKRVRPTMPVLLELRGSFGGLTLQRGVSRQADWGLETKAAGRARASSRNVSPRWAPRKAAA